MDSYSKILSTAVPLLEKEVRSEDIFPKRFLGSEVSNFGKHLFHNWRFHADGSLNDDFTLNRDKYSGNILLVESSFSSKSYSKQAIQALVDYGFKAVICPNIGTDFAHAAAGSDLLALEVSQSFGKKLINASLIEPKSLILINNETKIIELKNSGISEKYSQRNLSA